MMLNYRSDEKRVEKLEKELSLTETSLRENPKSYCVWHQRTWVIEHLPNPNWKREIELCNRCLNLDERNCICAFNNTQSYEYLYTFILKVTRLFQFIAGTIENF